MNQEQGFPQALLAALERKHMTRKNLIEHMEVSDAAVSGWLNQRRPKPPSDDNIERLAALLEAPELLTYRHNNHGSPPPRRAGSRVQTLVRQSAPGLERNFGRAIEYPGVGVKHYQYVSPALVVDIRPVSAQRPQRMVRELWNLAVCAAIDNRAHTGRYHVLIAIGEEPSEGMELVAEASLLGVEVVFVTTDEDAANFITTYELTS